MPRRAFARFPAASLRIAAERGSLRLTPPGLATTPETFLRNDGTSTFRPKHSGVFSSEQLLAAEDRLLQRAAAVSGPTVDIAIVDALADQSVNGHRLSPEQAQAIAEIAVSGRQVDLLIGPAGAGKTTAMRALRRAWTQQRGRGSVVGLAPSAASAQVLADDLGIACENTAKWLYEHQRGRSRLQRGQLVILDEATLAGTFTLDRITAQAAEAGAKVLLVGDWAQLQSVEAGGAFAMLAEARDDTAELVDIHLAVLGALWMRAALLSRRYGTGTLSPQDVADITADLRTCGQRPILVSFSGRRPPWQRPQAAARARGSSWARTRLSLMIGGSSTPLSSGSGASALFWCSHLTLKAPRRGNGASSPS